MMRGKIIRTQQDAIDLVNEQHKYHQGKWLTMEAAKEYQTRAVALKNSSAEIKGQLYELAEELRKEYGVNQIEAINILNGVHVADYVSKYDCIQNKIPIKIKEKVSYKKYDDEQ